MSSPRQSVLLTFALLGGPRRIGGPRRTVGPLLAVELLLAVGLLLSADRADAARFAVTPGAETNSVRFESKAPAESFDGKSRQISGTIDCDPTALGDSIGIAIEVDAASLDTGIGLRNQHMRDNHLHTKQYPKITFTGGRLLPGHPGALPAGEPVEVTVAGNFTLHGVTQRFEVPAQVTWNAAEKALHVVASFQVKLSAFNIPRPQFLVMKLDEVQRITFDVVATQAP